MGHPAFQSGKYDTHFVENHYLPAKPTELQEPLISILAASAVNRFHWFENADKKDSFTSSDINRMDATALSLWKLKRKP